jgi:hypothetical protein
LDIEALASTRDFLPLPGGVVIYARPAADPTT